MIEIDGTYGEGGGQILRTSLALSTILKLPFRLTGIRQGRKKPGLQPQHLMAVNSAVMISSGDVSGAYKGSHELVFHPGSVQGGEFSLDIGTAGSTTLVLQTIIPPLLFAAEPAVIKLSGGTHVPFSPSVHYLQRVFIPVLERLGCGVKLTLESCGFYPRGGGKVRAEIRPVQSLMPLIMEERTRVGRISGISAVANLPEHIAVRQARAAEERLKKIECPILITTHHYPSPGRGSFIILFTDTPPSIAGFGSLGAPGKPAEEVGAEAASELLGWAETGAAFDTHLADQVVLYLALSKERSVFTTSSISRHLLTNLWVISRFLSFNYRVEGDEGHPGRITIN